MKRKKKENPEKEIENALSRNALMHMHVHIQSSLVVHGTRTLCQQRDKPFERRLVKAVFAIGCGAWLKCEGKQWAREQTRYSEEPVPACGNRLALPS